MTLDSWAFSVWSIPAILSALVALAVLNYLPFERYLRKRRSVRIFRALMWCVAIWSIGNVIEASATTAQGKLLGVCIAYPGIVFLPVAWLLWVCGYTRRDTWLFPRSWLLLLLVPCCSVLVAWTYPLHGLMWRNPELTLIEGHVSWRSERGWYWAMQMLYSYGLMFFSLVVILREMMQEPWARVELSLLGLVAVLPLTVSVLFALGITRGIWPVDLTSALFTVALIWLVVTVGDPVRRLIPGSRSLVIERVQSPILVLDASGAIVYENPAAQLISGAETELNHSAISEDGELIEVMLNGRRRYYDARKIPVDANEIPLGSVVLLSDRTELMELELSLEAINEAYRLKSMELETSAAGKTRFLANVSHELRSPLSSIVGFAELLKDGLVDDLTPDELELSEEIYSLGQRLLEQINRILDFEKAEAGALKLLPETISGSALQLELQAALEHMLVSDDLTYEIDIQVEADEICLDLKKARQIVLSSIGFLYATSPKGTKLYVTIRIETDGLFINLAQRGDDVRAPDEKALRDPFFVGTGDSLVKTTRELRIGMALVIRLVELHRGTLTIGQRATDWVAMRIRLPAIDAEIRSAA